jgi:ActR/RegA family two-component response regulator
VGPMMRTAAPRQRILVVEDDPIIATDLIEALEARQSAEVLVATSLKDAMRMLDGDLPDVAVVDLHLKDGDTGLQLAAALARSGVRVCVFSATLTERLSHLPHIYMPKPVPSETVATIVETQLALAAASVRNQLH